MPLQSLGIDLDQFEFQSSCMRGCIRGNGGCGLESPCKFTHDSQVGQPIPTGGEKVAGKSNSLCRHVGRRARSRFPLETLRERRSP